MSTFKPTPFTIPLKTALEQAREDGFDEGTQTLLGDLTVYNNRYPEGSEEHEAYDGAWHEALSK